MLFFVAPSVRQQIQPRSILICNHIWMFTCKQVILFFKKPSERPWMQVAYLPAAMGADLPVPPKRVYAPSSALQASPTLKSDALERLANPADEGESIRRDPCVLIVDGACRGLTHHVTQLNVGIFNCISNQYWLQHLACYTRGSFEGYLRRAGWRAYAWRVTSYRARGGST